LASIFLLMNHRTDEQDYSELIFDMGKAMEGTVKTDEKTVRFCKNALKGILHAVESSHSATLATGDGNLVAYRTLKEDIDADAIAAMSSTAVNIADVLSSVGVETENGKSYNVVSESEANKFALVHAGKLILCLLGDANMNIGRALQICKREGAAIGEGYEDLEKTNVVMASASEPSPHAGSTKKMHTFINTSTKEE